MSEIIDRLNAALEGRYRIERELGAGGMATVYLAEDLKHRRNVALKLLKPELAAVVGAERFLTEIETTANLQHPHILPLFDSGAADGFLFYVMPYVEGESLREKLEREHQLPVGEALSIAEKVAGALQYAHEQGVVHRDVKPANILLSRGEPLVADFGIALALSEAGSGRITETGLSLGTPHYMSPEQAAGDRSLDKRSDIYGLGCVLYEMLTGQPPYGGPTPQAVLAQILTGDPPRPTDQRKSIPANVEHAVMKALEKLPADRFDSAGAFAAALRDPGFRTGVEGRADVGGTVARWRRIAGVAVAAAALLAAVLVWGLLTRSEAPTVERQRILLGSGFVGFPGAIYYGVALAPDGSGIVFPDTAGLAGSHGYWWKPSDEPDAAMLPNLDGGESPVFSPDGRWLAMIVDGQLRKQPLEGGTTVLLADSVTPPGVPALDWLDDGTLLYEDAGPVVQRVSADGGPSDTVALETDVGWPIQISGLIGGGGALVSSCTDGNCSANRLYLLDLERDTAAVLADGVVRAWPIRGDRVVYVDRRGAVFVADLDRSVLRLGSPTPLFDGVATFDDGAEMVLGRDGTLLYARGDATRAGAPHRVVWVDRDGGTEPVDPGWAVGDFRTLALAPDDQRLAISIFDGSAHQLWAKELPVGPLTTLTVEDCVSRRPAWTPDGRYVAYVCQGGGGVQAHIRILRADGSSPAPDTLLVVEGRDLYEIETPAAAGGPWVVRAGDTNDGAADIGHFTLDGDRAVTWILGSSFNENSPSRSPDGRWIAYSSEVSGRLEVYVRPFPETGTERIQVSTGGGSEPLWSDAGNEIFFRDAAGWMVAATVDTTPRFRVTSRERLFNAEPFRRQSSHRRYDVTRDGQRFIMIERASGGDEGTRGRDLILVDNWLEEVERVVERR